MKYDQLSMPWNNSKLIFLGVYAKNCYVSVTDYAKKDDTIMKYDQLLMSWNKQLIIVIFRLRYIACIS